MTINQLYSELQEQQEIAKHGTAHDQHAAIERIKEIEDELEALPDPGQILSLHGLDPSSPEYKEIEGKLIQRICDIEMEDDLLDKHIRGYD
jgi:hypothetical protein|tara:strand:+ start:1147 stop:1419 length:273 start_codon:yes stop_codon:yes gene_type:complete